MVSIKEKILEIKKRPAMFLGKNYICCLKSFLDGIMFVGFDMIKDKNYLDEFQKYIESKYGMNSHSWDRILLHYSTDESTALTLFFEEIESYEKYLIDD